MKLGKIGRLIGVSSFGLLLGVTIGVTTADSVQAAVHYTPRSWRGTYYTSAGDEMHVNTYSVSLNGSTLYKSLWSGYHKLSFARTGAIHGHALYTFNSLAKYGYESSRNWRGTYKNGHKELINYLNMGYITVWHAPYKKFHGYRMETLKAEYLYNTFYDKDSHCVLSDYRPTQKSKAIFEAGSHVIPTSHEWDYFTHNNRYITAYRYKNGSWHNMGTTDTES